MKLLGLFRIFIFLPVLGFSQSEKITSPVNQIDLLYEKGVNIIIQDSLQSFQLINEGLTLAKKENDQYRISKGILNLIGHDKHYGNHQAVIDKSLQIMHLGVSLSRGDSIVLIGNIGTALDKLGAYQLAIEYRRAVKKVHRVTDGGDAYYPTENIAFMFSKLEQYDSANYYYEAAHKIAERMNAPNVLMHCNNNIGYNYMLQGNLKQSKKYYVLALELFESNPAKTPQDSILYGLALANLGTVYEKQKKHAIAVEHLVQSNKILDKVGQTFLPENHISLASNYISLGKTPLAKVYLDKAEVDLMREVDILFYYKILSRYYKVTKQFDLAIITLEKHVVKQKSLLADKTKNAKVNDLISFQTNRIKSELKLLQLIRKNDEEIHSLKIKIITILSVAGFLLLLFLFLKYKSDRKKKDLLKDIENQLNKERLRRQEVERERLQEELLYKNKDITDFAIDITRKHEFIETILVKLSELKKTPENTPLLLTKVIQYVKTQLQIGGNLKMFQENVDKVNHEFINVLAQKYPDLTTNEQQICALLRLQLSTKEIATIKNVEIDSVKTMRYRLRKKLNIDSETNLNQFLKSI